MQEKTHILDRVSSFSLLLTMIILMIIGAALIPLVDVGSSPKPRQGKTLTISYGWRNASPKVVEQEVTSKIEGLVSAVKGVAEVSSESYFGSGRVTVVLKKEADVSAVKFEISSLLKQVRKKLPEEVSYPELTGGEVVNDGAPQKESPVKHLLTYQVNSNLKGEQIKEYVEKNVEPVVRAWEEVKSVDVTGGTSKYMEITYDPLIVANYGLTVADVEDGIKSFIGKSDIVGDVMYRDEDGEQSRNEGHPLPPQPVHRIHFQDRVVDNDTAHHHDTYHRHDVQRLAQQPQDKEHPEHIDHDFRQDDQRLHDAFELRGQDEIQQCHSHAQHQHQFAYHLPTGIIIACKRCRIARVGLHEPFREIHDALHRTVVRRNLHGIIIPAVSGIQPFEVLALRFPYQVAQRYVHPVIVAHGVLQQFTAVHTAFTDNDRQRTGTLIDGIHLILAHQHPQPGL